MSRLRYPTTAQPSWRPPRPWVRSACDRCLPRSYRSSFDLFGTVTMAIARTIIPRHRTHQFAANHSLMFVSFSEAEDGQYHDAHGGRRGQGGQDGQLPDHVLSFVASVGVEPPQAPRPTGSSGAASSTWPLGGSAGRSARPSLSGPGNPGPDRCCTFVPLLSVSVLLTN